MNEKDVETLMEQCQNQLMNTIEVKKLDYVLDFGSVSAIISLSHN